MSKLLLSQICGVIADRLEEGAVELRPRKPSQLMG